MSDKKREWAEAEMRRQFAEAPSPARYWTCPRCGPLDHDGVRQASRDEACLSVCRFCGEVVEDDLPF